MARSKTHEATEHAVNNAGNENRPPDTKIEAAVALLKRWAPKRLNPKELPERGVAAYECTFCHVKAQSNAEDPRCPQGCHDGQKSTMRPIGA